MEYRKFSELNGKTLKKDDIVYLKEHVYIVHRRYLNETEEKGNEVIFRDLGIRDKVDFCSKCYGYKANDGGFPECRTEDFEALTRVTLELFKLIEGIKTSIKQKELKNPTHLVIWEEDRDPVKFCTSLIEANNFIKSLVEKSSVKKDSILLIEIKSAKKVNVEKHVKTVQYKI